MEDFEDDFGYVYADVEVQASSAINGVQNFAPFYTETGEDINGGNDTKKMNVKLCSEDGPSKPNSLGNLEAIDGSDGSDSEDDLNIVLNDEDCNTNKFPVVSRGNMKSDEDEDEDGVLALKDFKVFSS